MHNNYSNTQNTQQPTRTDQTLITKYYLLLLYTSKHCVSKNITPELAGGVAYLLYVRNNIFIPNAVSYDGGIIFTAI